MSVRVTHETYDYLKGSQSWEWHALCADCSDGICTGDGREGWEEALTWALGHRALKHGRVIGSPDDGQTVAQDDPHSRYRPEYDGTAQQFQDVARFTERLDRANARATKPGHDLPDDLLDKASDALDRALDLCLSAPTASEFVTDIHRRRVQRAIVRGILHSIRDDAHLLERADWA